MENNSIFRKKSMDKISSPEQLNDYICVCTPGIWMVIAAVILLLVGVCVWGIFGRLDTVLTAVAMADGQSVTVYIPEEDLSSAEGKTVTINGVEYNIADGEVSDTPVAVSADSFSEYALHVGNLTTGQWVYGITFSAQLTEGTYEAQVIIESVSPMSFVLN